MNGNSIEFLAYPSGTAHLGLGSAMHTSPAAHLSKQAVARVSRAGGEDAARLERARVMARVKWMVFIVTASLVANVDKILIDVCVYVCVYLLVSSAPHGPYDGRKRVKHLFIPCTSSLLPMCLSLGVSFTVLPSQDLLAQRCVSPSRRGC